MFIQTLKVTELLHYSLHLFLTKTFYFIILWSFSYYFLQVEYLLYLYFDSSIKYFTLRFSFLWVALEKIQMVIPYVTFHEMAQNVLELNLKHE